MINLDIKLLTAILSEIVRRHELAEQSSDWDIQDPLVEQSKQLLAMLESLKEADT